MRTRRCFAALLLASLAAGCATTVEHRSVGRVLDDATIASSVKTRLAADPRTKSLPIEVEVERGVVTLRGSLSSDAARVAAAEVARAAPGVQEVVNQIALEAVKPDR